MADQIDDDEGDLDINMKKDRQLVDGEHDT